MAGQIGGDFSAIPTVKSMSAEAAKEPVLKDGQQVVQAVADQPIPQQPITKEELEKVVSGMNDFLKASPNTHLKFEFHDKLHEYYVTIVDENTKEVVREIPPKKMLDMFAAMTEFLGLMVDKKI